MAHLSVGKTAATCRSGHVRHGGPRRSPLPHVRLRTASRWVIRPTTRWRPCSIASGGTGVWPLLEACRRWTSPGYDLSWRCGEKRRPPSVARVAWRMRRSGERLPGLRTHRHPEQVLPTWESVLPGAVQGALRTAEVAAEAESVLEEVLAATGIDRAACGLDVPAVMALSPAVRRLRCVPG